MGNKSCPQKAKNHKATGGRRRLYLLNTG